MGRLCGPTGRCDALQRSSATASVRAEQQKAENVNEQGAQMQHDLEPARINQFDLLI